MIQINLLPKEYQKAAKTPVLMFGIIVGGAALTVVAICLYCYLWFNVVVLKERLEGKRDEVLSLQQSAAQVDSLLEDIADYKEREKAIINIKTNRILWSKKLDELIQLTPETIWVIRLDMREYDPREYKSKGKGKGGKAAQNVQQTGGYLRLMCYSLGSNVERMTSFRERLKGTDEFYARFLDDAIKPSNFFSDFINISQPEWKFVVVSGYKEPNNLRFTIRLDLRPLYDVGMKGKG
jgi:Tfp pilus assembly protein PilN